MLDNSKVDVQGSNHFVVVDLNAGQPLERFDYGMLINNDIQGVIKVSESLMNGITSLRYDITNYKMFATMFNEKMSWSTIVSVLKECSEILIDTEEYMLNSGNFLLDPEYIYIHKTSNSVGLIYLPLKQMETSDFTIYSLAKYILNNAKFEEHDPNNCFGKLMNFLNGTGKKSFKDFLNVLDGIDVKPMESHVNNSYKPKKGIKVNVKKKQAVSKVVDDNATVIGHKREYDNDQTQLQLDTPEEKKSSFGFGKKSSTSSTAILLRDKNQEEIRVLKERFVIGNNPLKCDYSCLSNEAISRVHAEIVKKGNDYYLIDNNSTNKTYINDERLTPKTQYKLTDGDKVKFANELYTFKM